MQGDDGDERTADMQQEHDADEGDDGALFDQCALKGLDRPVDEVRTVVDRFDAHALRKARRPRRPILSANQPPGTSTNTKFNRDKPREPAFSMRAAVQR